MDINKEFLTTSEAADLVRRSPETLKRWRRLRKGPPFARVLGRTLYRRDELIAWASSTRDEWVAAPPARRTSTTLSAVA